MASGSSVMYATRGSNPATEACALDQPTAHRDQPRIPSEIREADPPPACQAVSRTERSDHRLLEEVDALRAFVLAARLRGVLETQRDVQAPVAYTGDELVGASLGPQ